MTFLERILETKRVEVARANEQKSSDTAPSREAGRFAAAIRTGGRLAIISEIKKASPSKGLIQPDFDPVRIAKAYERAGARAISILTDQTYFQGSIDYLAQVRTVTNLPLLRKDFIIDRVQIDEACAAGADAILLIVAALTKETLEDLSSYAQSNGLDVLIEVHNADELAAAVSARPSVLGINNRDLHSFHVNLETTVNLMQSVPADVPVIAESGVQTPEDAIMLANAGVDGLLIGESLMRPTDDAARGQLLQSFAVEKRRGTIEGAVG